MHHAKFYIYARNYNLKSSVIPTFLNSVQKKEKSIK